MPLLLFCQRSLSETRVTDTGIKARCASHAGRLDLLRFDACPASTSMVLAVLCRQPGVCLWNPCRGHLPRWTNVAHTLLCAKLPDGRQRLRLLLCPEAHWAPQAGLCAAAALGLAAYAAVLLMLLVTFLLLTPFVGVGVTLTVLLAAGAGQRSTPRILFGVMSQAEALLSAVLLGVLGAEPAPPPPLDPHYW